MFVLRRFRESVMGKRLGLEKTADFFGVRADFMRNAALQEPTLVARVVGTPNRRNFL
jgi:hypothetical protein